MKSINSKIYGQFECKHKIKQIICKWVNNNSCNGDIIGIKGSPGIGKTYLSTILSNTLNIPFIHMSLSGHSDADIFMGHDYAYSGAQPGLIISKMIDAKQSRCIMYFDELDKTCKKNNVNEIHNFLISITDPNNNNKFQDKFFQNIYFPLQNVIIIFSYNNSTNIDSILYDRITEIEMKPYTINEKIMIAKNFIMKELCKKVGITDHNITINNNTMEYIIENYTNEAGLRDLKRKLEDIILEINVKKIYGHVFKKNISINISDINKYIMQSPTPINILFNNIIGHMYLIGTSQIGIGVVIPINIIKNANSNGSFIKMPSMYMSSIYDSINISFNMIVNILQYDIVQSFYNTNKHGIYINFGNSGVIIDGYSGSCCFAIAFMSYILNISINNNATISGDIDLNGNIKSITCILSKIITAKKKKFKILFLPHQNKFELKKLIDRDRSICKYCDYCEMSNNTMHDFMVVFINTIFDTFDYFFSNVDIKSKLLHVDYLPSDKSDD